jgi:hypothetical protein
LIVIEMLLILHKNAVGMLFIPSPHAEEFKGGQNIYLDVT